MLKLDLKRLGTHFSGWQVWKQRHLALNVSYFLNFLFYILRLQYFFLYFLLPSKPFHYSFLFTFKFMASSLIMATCIYMYIHICIPKRNLFNLYNVTCIYISRSDNLVLDSQLCRPPWWRLFFSLPTFLSCLFSVVPVMLSAAVRPSGLSLSTLACLLMLP